MGRSGADTGQAGDRRQARGTPTFGAGSTAGLGGRQKLRMEIQMNQKTEWTRRLFAAALAGSPAIAQTSAAPPAVPPRRPQQPEPLPFADTLVFTRKDVET